MFWYLPSRNDPFNYLYSRFSRFRYSCCAGLLPVLFPFYCRRCHQDRSQNGAIKTEQTMYDVQSMGHILRVCAQHTTAFCGSDLRQFDSKNNNWLQIGGQCSKVLIWPRRRRRRSGMWITIYAWPSSITLDYDLFALILCFPHTFLHPQIFFLGRPILYGLINKLHRIIVILIINYGNLLPLNYRGLIGAARRSFRFVRAGTLLLGRSLSCMHACISDGRPYYESKRTIRRCWRDDKWDLPPNLNYDLR